MLAFPTLLFQLFNPSFSKVLPTQIISKKKKSLLSVDLALSSSSESQLFGILRPVLCEAPLKRLQSKCAIAIPLSLVYSALIEHTDYSV